jgi:hypothetical protein
VADSKQEILRQAFRGHAERWRRETGGFSSPAQIVSHDDYLAVVAMGQDVVPLILEDLSLRGGYWYPALRALTGQSPVDESIRGRPKLMTDAWLAWGRTHGLLAG